MTKRDPARAKAARIVRQDLHGARRLANLLLIEALRQEGEAERTERFAYHDGKRYRIMIEVVDADN